MRFQVTATAAAMAVSQELSPFGRALGASHPGTKYPMRRIPHFDLLPQLQLEVLLKEVEQKALLEKNWAQFMKVV